MTLSYSKALETQVSFCMQTHIPTEETSSDVLDELFTTHCTQQFGALLIFWWFLFLMFLVPETSVIMRYLLPSKTPLPCLEVWRGWTRCKFVAGYESFDLLRTIVKTGLTRACLFSRVLQNNKIRTITKRAFESLMELEHLWVSFKTFLCNLCQHVVCEEEWCPQNFELLCKKKRGWWWLLCSLKDQKSIHLTSTCYIPGCSKLCESFLWRTNERFCSKNIRMSCLFLFGNYVGLRWRELLFCTMWFKTKFHLLGILCRDLSKNGIISIHPDAVTHLKLKTL